MKIENVFKILQENIHTTVIATVNEDGRPETRVIDIMLSDKSGVYFITAKGKRFYEQLICRKFVSISGFYGKDTLSSVSVSVKGYIEEMDNEYVERVFSENRYMSSIYPTKQSRNTLVVFKVYKGTGEYFDLSKKPIERFSFSFGGFDETTHGYFVRKGCTLCKNCIEVCPQGCIDFTPSGAIIRQNNCLHCGNCKNACPVGCIERI